MFKTDTNTPAGEIETRIAKLQKALRDEQMDGALILQNSDLFYFSGTIQQSHLYIPAQGDAVLMTRKSFERAQAESPLKQIAFLSSPKKIAAILKTHGLAMPQRLGMELDVLPVNLFHMYINLFEGPDILDVSPAIRMLRAIKSPHEQAIMAEAARLSDAVAAHVKEIIQPGMTELELAGLVEAHARKLGHQGFIRMRLWGNELFYGHLLAGASAAVPSYLASPTGGSAANPAVAQGAGFASIAPNEPVLVDYAFAFNGYISDHTRIFSIGQLPDELMNAHTAMLKIQEGLKQAAKPGVPAGQIYEMGIALAADAGLGDHFMGAGPQRIRFVGHGVGLELDEFPFLAKGQQMPLQEGMVIALEPKAVFPGKGVVGIENTHVVTQKGLNQLGHYPDEITVV
jgi:Xaa-Pro dipeptidase